MNDTAITQIGKYHVISELGRGGMGVVYRAEDRYIGREVAIKTLTSVTPELMSRFRNEAKFGKLNHPNIVTIYDFGDQDGMPYIVMQFLQGASLEKLLSSGRPMPLDRKLDIIRQVCAGLGYAHDLGVVHRDIKSANIMVEPDGTAKIVDFGIARLESVSSQGLTSNTVTGAVIGTLHYISPERLKGDLADGRSDIWSVGVMLYQMVTGKLPFEGEVGQILQRVVNEPHPSPRGLNPDCSEELEQIIDRALAKNPDDRYSTAEEMEADIEAINEGLKKQRASEYLERAQQLMQQEKLSEARTLLAELQRLDPQNLEVKKLLREVAYQQARQAKSEQLRQLTTQAEEAVLSQRYSEAVDFYTQAAKVDKSDTGLVEKLQNAVRLRDNAAKVRELLQNAQVLREQADFTRAQEQIERALELDPKSTDLRNEKVAILREAERTAREGQVRGLLQNAGDALRGGRLTEAIDLSREALNIDRANSRAQQIYQDAVSRQEEGRRRQALEQLVFAIEESIHSQDLDRASELVRRGLEKLPGETALLRLKTEVETAQVRILNAQIVDAAAAQVQELLFDNPRQALDVVQKALEQLPRDENLTALKARVVEQLNKRDLDEVRSRYVQQAQAALGQRNFEEAEHLIESAIVDCGESESFTYLLLQARTGAESERRRKLVAAATAEAEKLIAAADYAGAVKVLEPAVKSTGDPSLSGLLKRASELQADAARRIQSALARAEALAAQDAAQALQFLAGQAAAVLADAKIKSLAAELRARSERATAFAAAFSGAVQRTNESLARKDYASGVDALESVRSAYGDSPELAEAVRNYEGRRTSLAGAEVATAIEAARQSLARQQGPAALEQLRSASEAVQFADAATQAEWKRLGAEAVKSGTRKVSTTGTIELPDAVPEKSRTPMYAGIGAAAVLVIGIALYFAMKPGKAAEVSTTAAVSGPVGITVELDATPWATVGSVQGPGGRPVNVNAGEDATPVKLLGQLPGTYQVVFVDPDGGQHPQACAISATNRVCRAQMDGYPIGIQTAEDFYRDSQSAADNEVASYLCQRSIAVYKQAHNGAMPPEEWATDCTSVQKQLDRVVNEQHNYVTTARQLLQSRKFDAVVPALDRVTLKSLLTESNSLKRQAINGKLDGQS